MKQYNSYVYLTSHRVEAITRLNFKVMEKQEVIDLMRTSKTSAEWNANCDKVKAACGGYPYFWYMEIIMSGLADKIMSAFGKSTKITIH